MALTEKILSEFELAEKNLNGQKDSALHRLRQEAIGSFQKLGIPGNRHEEWKYTNIRAQLPESLSLLNASETPVKAGDFNSFKNIKATKLVFVNGIFHKEIGRATCR